MERAKLIKTDEVDFSSRVICEPPSPEPDETCASETQASDEDTGPSGSQHGGSQHGGSRPATPKASRPATPKVRQLAGGSARKRPHWPRAADSTPKAAGAALAKASRTADPIEFSAPKRRRL